MGALTIKPYAFTYRPWEIDKIPVANIFSTFPEVIVLHFKNQTVMRVTSSSNSDFITNSLRFSTNLINKTFFPKTNTNLNFSSVLHNIYIHLSSFFFALQRFVQFNNKPIQMLTRILKILKISYFYKNFFSIDYVLPNLHQNQNTDAFKLFGNATHSKLYNRSQNSNNHLNFNRYFAFSLENGNLHSDLYITTNENLREYSLDFYLYLCKAMTNAHKLYIFYLSKINNIILTKQNNILEYHMSNKSLTKTILFCIYRSIHLPVIHFFFSKNTANSFNCVNLENPLNLSLRWISMPGQYFVKNDGKLNKIKTNSNVYDFSFVKLSTTNPRTFLNVFALVLVLHDIPL